MAPTSGFLLWLSLPFKTGSEVRTRVQEEGLAKAWESNCKLNSELLLTSNRDTGKIDTKDKVSKRPPAICLWLLEEHYPVVRRIRTGGNFEF